MDEREILKNLAELLWKNELENTSGLSLLERHKYLTEEHPLGRAGLQEPGCVLTLLINSEFFEVQVIRIEV